MEFIDLASSRCSVRKFKQQTVEKEKIESILQAAKLAPTAHNNQPQQIIVVESKDGLDKLKKCTECHYNAPLAFIISYDRDKSWKRSYDGEDSGAVDCSIISTHMMLQATALGIGSTWVMYFIKEAVIEEFNLDSNIIPVAILVMGYSDQLKCSPSHENRVNPEDYTTYR